jgi:unsaturated rhamnogalacturonyl hydrolase
MELCVFTMTHRLHLHVAALAVLCAITGSGSAHALLTAPAPALHHPARVVSSAELPVPEKQRAPFGWGLATITTADKPPLVLKWDSVPEAASPTHFRITVGLDERDAKEVEVTLAQSGRRLGLLDVRFPAQFQVHQLAITPADAAEMLREGVVLRLVKGSDLEILTTGTDLPAALQPHLMSPGNLAPMEEFYLRLRSLASVQQFGWMEGCVLEGLLDLGELPDGQPDREGAALHLASFIRDGRLIYESPRSAPSDGRIYGIEATLPFAALARTDPAHPLLSLALDGWNERRRPSGAVQDGSSMSSEGTYTVAYPMALMAKARNDDALMRDALQQCRHRLALFDGADFWRTLDDNGTRHDRNWARGIAWQLLGLVRTLEVARDRSDIADLLEHLRLFSGWIMQHQRPDGLWSVIITEPGLTADTSGSAGIAAALARAAGHGWLSPEARDTALRAYGGLHAHLTADGFLGGASQSNKAGLELQRSDYRVIYQMGMGLLAQLAAALEQRDPPQFPRPHARSVLRLPRMNAWDVEWPKGKPTPLHQHAYDILSVTIRGGTITSYHPRQTEPRLEGTSKPGSCLYSKRGLKHVEEGLSQIPQRKIFLEFKDEPPATPATVAAPHESARLVLENERISVWDIQWPAGESRELQTQSRHGVIVCLQPATIEGKPRPAAPGTLIPLTPASNKTPLTASTEEGHVICVLLR